MDEDVRVKLEELKQLQLQILHLVEHLHGSPNTAEVWLDNVELCALFKVTDRTLYRWRKLGVITPVILGGKCFYAKSAIDGLMQHKK